MTTRYENTDGIDDKISFGEQVIKPSLKELQNLFEFIIENNKNIKTKFLTRPLSWLDRNELKEYILYVANNNQKIYLPLQGSVVIDRLRKEEL